MAYISERAIPPAAKINPMPKPPSATAPRATPPRPTTPSPTPPKAMPPAATPPSANSSTATLPMAMMPRYSYPQYTPGMPIAGSRSGRARPSRNSPQYRHLIAASWICSPQKGQAFMDTSLETQVKGSPATPAPSSQGLGAYGKILPGFRMPLGSNTRLIWRINSIWALSSAIGRYRRRVTPMPCSPVMVPPSERARR